jgi:hypothetical protein
MSIAAARRKYHQQLCRDVVRIRGDRASGYPNFADGTRKTSRELAWKVAERIGCSTKGHIAPQTVGTLFERVTQAYLEEAFSLMAHLRPGDWRYSCKGAISEFDQYRHLAELEELLKVAVELKASVGRDYIIRPDILISRLPVTDDEINRVGPVVASQPTVASLTPLRKRNVSSLTPILHASISCKWTIRSGRVQNIRAEALNLIRNRKGNLPHVIAVTFEPMPTRISSLALGTGDVDCVYHGALYELQAALEELGNEDQSEVFQTLLEGRRLRDISDLPFDLAV